MLDVGWGELLFQVADDLSTHSILIYMESVGDARSFLSAAREISLRKPIIVIKAGKSKAGARAVAAHSGTNPGQRGIKAIEINPLFVSPTRILILGAKIVLHDHRNAIAILVHA
jgi:hypothetical protein